MDPYILDLHRPSKKSRSRQVQLSLEPYSGLLVKGLGTKVISAITAPQKLTQV